MLPLVRSRKGHNNFSTFSIFAILESCLEQSSNGSSRIIENYVGTLYDISYCHLYL
jgi:hypothetical protein